MKKGLFTAAVIAAMMMTQPVMAQEVVGQTEEIVAQTEETEQEDVPESPESDMAEEYEGTSVRVAVQEIGFKICVNLKAFRKDV